MCFYVSSLQETCFACVGNVLLYVYERFNENIAK